MVQQTGPGLKVWRGEWVPIYRPEVKPAPAQKRAQKAARRAEDDTRQKALHGAARALRKALTRQERWERTRAAIAIREGKKLDEAVTLRMKLED